MTPSLQPSLCLCILAAACDPCLAGAKVAARDAFEDGSVCAPYGTSRSDGPSGGRGEWQNCYTQTYDSNYYYALAEAGCAPPYVITNEGDCPGQTVLDTARPIDHEVLFTGATGYIEGAPAASVLTGSAAWDEFQAGLVPPMELPAVDFASSTVVAVRMQTPSSCEFVVTEYLVAEVGGRSLLRVLGVDNSRLCDDQCSEPGAYVVIASVPYDPTAIGCAARVDACGMRLDR